MKISHIVQMRMDALGLNQSELARLVGVKPQNIQQLLAGKVTNPRYLLKLAEAIGVTPGILLGEDDVHNFAAAQAPDHHSENADTLPPQPGGGQSTSTTPRTDSPPVHANVRPAPDAPAIPARHEVRRDFPVYGAASAGGGDFFEMHDVVDYIGRPPALGPESGAYGLYVIGDSMAPKWDEGDTVYVHPGRPVTVGCDVVVQISNGDEVTRALLKRLVRRDVHEIELVSLNPAYPDRIVIPMAEVRHIHRVLKTAELLG
ncbi:MAG: helix-turn-helix domain-containing protein [Alphaproteobacteria bacterium]|nr:helix-turn-helix domain-containing protein [Alphaproteobacteria bacterium]